MRPEDELQNYNQARKIAEEGNYEEAIVLLKKLHSDTGKKLYSDEIDEIKVRLEARNSGKYHFSPKKPYNPIFGSGSPSPKKPPQNSPGKRSKTDYIESNDGMDIDNEIQDMPSLFGGKLSLNTLSNNNNTPSPKKTKVAPTSSEIVSNNNNNTTSPSKKASTGANRTLSSNTTDHDEEIEHMPSFSSGKLSFNTPSNNNTSSPKKTKVTPSEIVSNNNNNTTGSSKKASNGANKTLPSNTNNNNLNDVGNRATFTNGSKTYEATVDQNETLVEEKKSTKKPKTSHTSEQANTTTSKPKKSEKSFEQKRQEEKLKEEEKKRIGRLGEEFVYNYLKNYFTSITYDVNNKIDGYSTCHIIKEEGLGCILENNCGNRQIEIVWLNKLGETGEYYDMGLTMYEINKDENKKLISKELISTTYIEVKSTAKKAPSKAFFSENELALMKAAGKGYFLFRLDQVTELRDDKGNIKVTANLKSICNPYPQFFKPKTKTNAVSDSAQDNPTPSEENDGILNCITKLVVRM